LSRRLCPPERDEQEPGLRVPSLSFFVGLDLTETD